MSIFSHEIDIGSLFHRRKALILAQIMTRISVTRVLESHHYLLFTRFDATNTVVINGQGSGVY